MLCSRKIRQIAWVKSGNMHPQVKNIDVEAAAARFNATNILYLFTYIIYVFSDN